MNTITELKPGQDLGTEVKRHQKVLVDFGASWCEPCQTLSAMLNKMKLEGKLPASIIKVNIDEHQRLAKKYHIDGVPTIILFVNGKIKAVSDGLRGGYPVMLKRFESMVKSGESP